MFVCWFFNSGFDVFFRSFELKIYKMLDILAPFVYWAQTEHQITLKIDLIDVKVCFYSNFVCLFVCFFTKHNYVNNLIIFQDVDVKLGEKKLEFMAHGKGARGPNTYRFTLDFHLPINSEVSQSKNEKLK